MENNNTQLAMKKILRQDGWDEVTTRNVRVTMKVNRVFLTAGQWVDFGKKQPKMYEKGRHHCEYCNTAWEDFSSDAPTYLVPTNKGNIVLCQSCFDKIQVTSAP